MSKNKDEKAKGAAAGASTAPAKEEAQGAAAAGAGSAGSAENSKLETENTDASVCRKEGCTIEGVHPAHEKKKERKSRSAVSTEKKLAAFVLGLCGVLDSLVAAQAEWKGNGDDAAKVNSVLLEALPIYTPAKALADEIGGAPIREIDVKLASLKEQLGKLDFFTNPADAATGKDLMDQVARLQKKKTQLQGA